MSTPTFWMVGVQASKLSRALVFDRGSPRFFLFPFVFARSHWLASPVSDYFLFRDRFQSQGTSESLELMLLSYCLHEQRRGKLSLPPFISNP